MNVPRIPRLIPVWISSRNDSSPFKLSSVSQGVTPWLTDDTINEFQVPSCISAVGTWSLPLADS